MKVETKFSPGDKVWSVNNSMVQKWTVCEFCDGEGELVGKNNKSRGCPECYRKGGKHEWISEGWHVGRELTIGQVRTEFTGSWCGCSNTFSNYGPQKEKYKEEYMCRETGIGSGSVHNAERLFATKEKATAEAKRLNGEK